MFTSPIAIVSSITLTNSNMHDKTEIYAAKEYTHLITTLILVAIITNFNIEHLWVLCIFAIFDYLKLHVHALWSRSRS